MLTQTDFWEDQEEAGRDKPPESWSETREEREKSSVRKTSPHVLFMFYLLCAETPAGFMGQECVHSYRYLVRLLWGGNETYGLATILWQSLKFLEILMYSPNSSRSKFVILWLLLLIPLLILFLLSLLILLLLQLLSMLLIFILLLLLLLCYHYYYYYYYCYY